MKVTKLEKINSNTLLVEVQDGQMYCYSGLIGIKGRFRRLK